MAVYPSDYALPGLMWPGDILPAQPVTATIAAIFWAGDARGLWNTGGQSVHTQSVLSTQYIQVPVTVTSTSGSYDPTSDLVQFAFTPVTSPVTDPSTWVNGSWATFPGPAYWAQCLVGPGTGGTALTAGTWQLWLKITDSPEVPVLQPATIQITP